VRVIILFNVPAGGKRTGRAGRFLSLFRSLDSDYFPQGPEFVRALPRRVELSRCLPFVVLHLVCLLGFFYPPSIFDLIVATLLYWLRMFAVTAFYHRYFAHRSFSTSRQAQFIFAFWASTSAQRGALWWASHHRQHHKLSDKPGDVHSPVQDGFWWSHIGWITSSANIPTDYKAINDLARYKELVWLNRFDWVPATLLALTLLFSGMYLHTAVPQLGTSGPQLLIWGFFVSTAVLFHGTCCINSVGHLLGTTRFATSDASRNNWLLALITMGEGWHNNHHRFQGSARQGLYWYEIDVTYYILLLFEKLGLIWNLHRPSPQAVRDAAKNSLGAV
jgi:stearoyl-CoA desaturase (delta-9 desaturase)